MKLYQFDANEAGSEEADGVLTVGVAVSCGAYFMIQRSLEGEGTEAPCSASRRNPGGKFSGWTRMGK